MTNAQGLDGGDAVKPLCIVGVISVYLRMRDIFFIEIRC